MFWVTPRVFAGRGGVRTDEAGTVTGDLTVRTTWDGKEADATVRCTRTSEIAGWFRARWSAACAPTAGGSRG
ncbi:hypothetical protein [Streptomyces hyaluromycini]|uniref:hypothetical protein n=1 Tax=Streptomyces hyaluromycini TaxID=1377993 RepID=UPI000B5C609C|nr:hypothetical protein [Streptomyces hyaluromycini]